MVHQLARLFFRSANGVRGPGHCPKMTSHFQSRHSTSEQTLNCAHNEWGGLNGDLNRERAALAEFTFNPNLSLVECHIFFDDTQAQTCPTRPFPSL